MGTMIKLTVNEQWLRQEPVIDRSPIAPLYGSHVSARSFTIKLTGIPFHNGNRNCSNEPIRGECNDLKL